MGWTRFILAFLSILVMVSCLKEEDLGEFDDTLFYSPRVSFPWGAPTFNMDVFLENADLDALRIIDTTLVPDSIPIFLYEGDYYVVPDTLAADKTEAFDLSDYSEELSRLNYFMLRTNSINRIPAEVRIQVYFLDQQQVVIDSLFETPLVLDAAETDEQGNLLEQKESWKNDTEFQDDEIERIAQIAYLRVSSVLIIEDAKKALNYYYTDQDVWIQIGMRLGFEIEL